MENSQLSIQALLDKEAIREAILCTVRGVDRHDFEEFSRGYHADAVEDHGVWIGNPSKYFDLVVKVSSEGWDAHHHFVTNQKIELAGDTAHVESYLLCVMRRRGGAIEGYAGRYVDRLERREGRWAVCQRVFLMEWTGNFSSSIDGFDASPFLSGSWTTDDPSYMRPLRIIRPERGPGDR